MAPDNTTDLAHTRVRACLAAARAALQAGAVSLRPQLLVSSSWTAPVQLAAFVQDVVSPSQIAALLREHALVFHVRPVLVTRWRPPAAAADAPAVFRAAVDCFSEQGRWRLLGALEHAEWVSSSIQFFEVLDVQNQPEWQVTPAVPVPAPRTPAVAARPAPAPARTQREKPLAAQPAAPLVGYLRTEVPLAVKELSVAATLERLAWFRRGRNDPQQLCARLTPLVEKARMEHVRAKFAGLAGAGKTSLEELLRLPPRDAGAALRRLNWNSSEALALGYWALSRDHRADGLALTDLAKSMSSTNVKVETALAQAPLVVSFPCPACAEPADYAVARHSHPQGVLSYRMSCAACGHNESWLRDGDWKVSRLDCSCPECASERQAGLLGVRQVEAEIRTLVSQARDDSAETTDRLIADMVEHDPSRFKDMHFEAVPSVKFRIMTPGWVESRLCRGTEVFALEDAKVVLRAIGAKQVRKDTPVGARSGGLALPTLSRVEELLLEGLGELSEDQMLREWLDALEHEGLLCVNKAQMKPLTVHTGCIARFELPADALDHLPCRGDYVAYEMVPEADAALNLLLAARAKVRDSACLGPQDIADALAADHTELKELLQQARTLCSPELDGILLAASQGQALRHDQIRELRLALKEEGISDEAGRVVYSALLWNYTNLGQDWLAAGPVSVSALTSGLSQRWTSAKELSLTTCCPRCRVSGRLTLTHVGGLNWKFHCTRCGHTADNGYGARQCTCDACLTSINKALGAATAASIFHRVLHAIEAQAAKLEAGPVMAWVSKGGISKLRREQHEKMAADVGWKRLELHEPAALLYFAMSGGRGSLADYNACLQMTGPLSAHGLEVLARVLTAVESYQRASLFILPLAIAGIADDEQDGYGYG